MRKVIAFGLLALVVSCSKQPRAKPGPLGEVGLSAKLPAGIKVPAQQKAFEATHEICAVAKEDEPAIVRVRWKAFTKDGASYLSWYSVELMNPVSGLDVTLEREPSKMDYPNANKAINANAVTGGPIMMATAIPLKCTALPSSNRAGSDNPTVYIRADGRSATVPVW